MNNRGKTIYALLLAVMCTIISVTTMAQCPTGGTLSPASNSLVCGTTMTITMTNATTGNGIAYQLQGSGGVNIGTPQPPSGNGTVIWSNVPVTTAGGLYEVFSTQSGCSNSIVTAAQYYSTPVPGGTVSASSSSLCSGSSVVFTATPTTAGSYNYQWYNGSNQPLGTNSASYTATSVDNYSVTISNSCGTATLTCPTITAGAPSAAPGPVSGPASAVAGTTSGYSVGAVSGATSYTWSVTPSSAGTVTPSGTSCSIAWSAGDSPGNVTVNVAAVGSCTFAASPYTVSIQPYLTAGAISPSLINASSMIVPNPSALTSAAATGGGGSYSYQWQSSPDQVTWTNSGSPTASVSNYSLSAQSTSYYYRMMVTSAGAVAYSNIASVIVGNCTLLPTTYPANQNYILTTTPRMPAMTVFRGQLTCQMEQVIQYFDGLGRLVQTSNVEGSPTYNDVVKPNVYDPMNREAVKYLPYTVNAGGNLVPTAVTDQQTFYNSPPTGVATDAAASATTDYDNSTLDRVIEQGAPGTTWQIVGTGGTGHTVKQVYTTNNSTSFASDPVNGFQVSRYDAIITGPQSRSLENNGFYGPGTLYVTITKDENWVSGRAGTTEEYKDIEGHIILKRVYNLVGSTVQQLSTYYVYDDLGDLSFVLPPLSGADGDAAITSATLNNLCYQYEYDERQRLTQKTIPGKGVEYTVYNYIDQPVATQDAAQRGLNTWIYSKYDALGRNIITGTWNNGGTSASPATVLTGVNGATAVWETPSSVSAAYTNNAWPTSQTVNTLTTNIYDRYTNLPGAPPAFTVTTGVSQMTRGLSTGKRAAILNTPTTMLWDVTYYDDLGRAVQGYSQHYLGGVLSNNNYDQVLTTYDFTNTPLTVTRNNWINNTSNSATLQVIVYNNYTYDHQGRKLQTWEQLTNNGVSPGPLTMLSQIDYNELGQVMTKHLHSTDGQTFLQNIAYTYNERGWLLSSTAALFQMFLQYNSVRNVTGITPVAQYNGNIASQSWGTAAAPNANSYVYTYDKLNRLLSGTGTTGYKETNIAYDMMGNITNLVRYDPTISTSGPIDNLVYTYTDVNGNYYNQVQNIQDNSYINSTKGLQNGLNTYQWDGTNGNLASSYNTNNPTQNKSFTYNLLNLPQTVTTSLQTLTYTYTATGEKLRKVANATLDYVSGIVYGYNPSQVISYIVTDEGMASFNGSTYNYEYYLGDNLGNTRVTFGTAGGTTAVLQTDDYYSFGLEILGNPAPSVKNDYLYNKKELQDEFMEYDYGARFYDPVIARWTNVDPLAEKGRRFSPYNYVEDNPIIMIDPDGMKEIYYSQDGTKIGQIGKNTDVRVVNSNVTNAQAAAYVKSGDKTTLNASSVAYSKYFKTVSDVTNDAKLETYTNNGKNCNKAARAQLSDAGLEPGSTINTKVDATSKLTADPIGGSISVQTQLNAGNPVMVGVQETKTDGTANDPGNTNSATGHFVVVRSSNVSTDGTITFNYLDNASTAKGKSADNNFTLNTSTGAMTDNTITQRNNYSSYEVSEVRLSQKK